MSHDIWGEDARIFRYAKTIIARHCSTFAECHLCVFYRPERWESPPADANAVPSVYANLMTFLSGPRACIGWRMALAE